MRVNPVHTRWPLPISLALCLFTLVFISSTFVRGQEGVAGDVPIVPKKQPPPDPNKVDKETPQVRVTTTLVSAPVTVVDSSGDFVYDLSETDFQVYDNGAPQRLQRFGLEQHPLAAVIVVETNDFIAPLLADVRPLAPLFSDLMLGPQGKAAVLFYGDHIRVAQDFLSDSDRLESTLRGMKVDGYGARLNDALIRAISMLEQRPSDERRVVVVFSDGFDHGSEGSKEDVVQRATTANVTIYGVRFSPAKAMLGREQHAPPQDPLNTNVARPTPPNKPQTPTMEDNVWSTPMVPTVPILLATGEFIRSTLAKSLVEFYAGYTGGVYYGHWSKKAVQDELAKIASEIQSQYDLAYAPDTLSQTGFHRIEVKVKRKGMKVRTRAGYFVEVSNP